jgi:hypothetical protein
MCEILVADLWADGVSSLSQALLFFSSFATGVAMHLRTLSHVVLLLPVAGLLGCATTAQHPDSSTPDDSTPYISDYHDLDKDGVAEEDGDCVDTDPNIYPGRAEDCNGIDDNCNKLIDEGWPDTDGDATPDCLDTETCDGLDNDGDGLVDEDFGDADGDGVVDCLDAEKCDGIDNNGDGRVDEGYDADLDGYTQCGTATVQADCDDTDASIHPGAKEIVDDGLDNDCDGRIDEGGWSENDLIITEVMNNPLSVNDGYGEWFEVYNYSGHPLYLNGMVITNSLGTEYHVVDTGHVINLATGNYFIFANNGNPDENGNIEPDYVYSDISLSNESDDLILEMDGLTIAHLSWDDGATMPDPNGASMNLDAWAVDPLWANDPVSWCTSSEQWTTISDRGSPGTDNELCPNADHDHDGYSVDDGDCDDANPAVYPGAPSTDNTIDYDCDGILNTMPNAVASFEPKSSTLSTCNPLQLLGEDSSDPEGTALTYAWTLDSAPVASERTTDSIEEPTSMNPIFYPDVAGDYVFSLVVNDGDDSSYTSTETITITDRGYENDPITDAGPDQSTASTSTCRSSSYGTVWTCPDCSGASFTLDSSATYDPDGDPMTYVWGIVSGSEYGSIADPTADTTTFTFSALSVDYGSTSTVSAEIILTATDCMTASTSDTLTLTFSCTGV